MVSLPLQPNDIFELAQGLDDGFESRLSPANSGYPSRQSAVQPGREGYHTRNLIKWFVPDTGIVEMYINPQKISIVEKKAITKTRTKGGFSVSYWGEELIDISIQGTTGSSGVEGINVLRDVYRNENLALDTYALSLAAKNNADENELGLDNLLVNTVSLVSSTVASLVNDALLTGDVQSTVPKPTLASLAFGVEMYHSGWTYRGFFESMSVTESAEKIGLFDYDIKFTATGRRGWRNNFLAWHRSATHGPSNSDPDVGIPHSFGALTNSQPLVPAPVNDNSIKETQKTLNDVLAVAEGIVDPLGFGRSVVSGLIG